jgi:hypothetical protein
MTENIKITFLQMNDNKDSNVAATLGIYVRAMDWYFAKLKLVKKKDGTFYVAPPSEEYLNPTTGKKEYSNFWWHGKKTSEYFQKEVMKALEVYFNEKGIQNPTHGNR